MALAPGTQLGSYQIVSLVGEGNFSEVYQARDPEPGQTVAVKLRHMQWSAEASICVDRGVRSERASLALSGPSCL